MNQTTKFTPFIVLILQCFSMVSTQSNVFGQAGELFSMDISGSILIGRKELQNLEIEQIIRLDKFKAFVPNKSKAGRLIAKPQKNWFYCQIKPAKNLYLVLSNPNLQIIRYYQIDRHGNYSFYQTGALFPFSQRQIHNNRFVFKIKENSEAVYLYIQTKMGQSFRVNLLNEFSLLEANHHEDLYRGLLYGFLIMMVIYHLFLWLITRELIYMIFSLYIFSTGLLSALFNGHGFEFLWSGFPFINQYFDIIFYVSLMSYIWFGREFLNTRQLAPLGHKFLNLLMFILFITCIFIIFKIDFLVDSISQIFSYILTLSLVTISIYVYINGYQPAKLFILGWIIYLIGVILVFLQTWGIFPQIGISFLAITTNIQTIFLSLAIAEKVKYLKIDKEKVMAENEKILKEQNQILERKVIERTALIQEKNEEIQEQSDSLERMYRELKKLNDQQEQEINRRTEELKKTYADLEVSSKELDTFLYRASHDLRRPLTTLMGLFELAKITLKEEEAKILFKNVFKTAQSMDKMLEKLIMLSDISNQKPHYEKIKFEKNFQKLKDDFRLLLQQYNVDLKLNVESKKTICTNKTLLNIILKNLIENAIIFNEDPSPYVSISYRKLDHISMIEVQDNGQGIEKQYLNKIFEMYFRGSEKSKGNGLGLYVVKKAVDKLNAEIIVKSDFKGQMGTVVTVMIPDQQAQGFNPGLGNERG